MKTIICVATGQPLANLIPILQFNPKKIILIATTSFKKQAKAFRDIIRDIKPNDIQVLMIEGCPDTGISEIGQFLDDKVIPKIDDWQNIAVNLTGGTKLHSFSLYQKLADKVHSTFYIDTANHKLEFYPTSNKDGYTEQLPSVLTIDLTLQGMGKIKRSVESNEMQWRNSVESRQQLTNFLVDNVIDLQNLIGSFNTIINGFYKDKSLYLKPSSLTLHSFPQGKARQVLEMGHDLGLVKWPNGKTVEFDNYMQARYFSGNWMEEYVWLCAQKIGFEEVACNVKFANITNNNQNAADNEIDLLAVHTNAMLAIECKAASSTSKDNVSQDMFHKLSGVAHRAGGLMCSKLFLSAFPMTYRNGQDIAALNHAREQNISILQAEDLINLPSILEKWKKTSRL